MSDPLSRKPEPAPVPPWPAHLGGLVWAAASREEGGGASPVGSDTGKVAQGHILPSGHPALDAALSGGGWPAHALIEALQPRGLHGEWRLLLPAVQALQARGAHVLLIAPPFTPYLPGLARLGLNPERLVWVKCRTPKEFWWAMEQALRCQALTAVLGWCPDPEPAATRRLQLAAGLHDGLSCLFRPAEVAAQPSAAPLRLLLRACPEPGALEARILKQRGRSGPHWLPLQSAEALQAGWEGLLGVGQAQAAPSPVHAANHQAFAPAPAPAPEATRPPEADPARPDTALPVDAPGALHALLDRLAHS